MALRPVEAKLHQLLVAFAYKNCRLHTGTYAGRRIWSAVLSAGLVFSPARARSRRARAARCQRPAGIGTVVDYDIEADAAAVGAAPSEYRDEIVEIFLARYEALWTSIARKYSRSCGVRHCDLDDAAQAVRIEAYKLLLEGAPPGIRWAQALWRRSEEAIRELSISGGSTGFAGMTGHERRRRSLEKLRSESGLSGEALLEAWNAKTAQTRSDPKRQGAIATKEDLVDHRMVPNGSTPWESAPDYEDPGVEQLLSASFTKEAMGAVTRACAKEPAIVGQVAQAWFTGTMEGAPMSCAEIARRIGVSRATVQRTMPRVRVLVREAVADYLVNS
jgi:hypothetical protein